MSYAADRSASTIPNIFILSNVFSMSSRSKDTWSAIWYKFTLFARKNRFDNRFDVIVHQSFKQLIGRNLFGMSAGLFGLRTAATLAIFQIFESLFGCREFERSFLNNSRKEPSK